MEESYETCCVIFTGLQLVLFNDRQKGSSLLDAENLFNLNSFAIFLIPERAANPQHKLHLAPLQISGFWVSNLQER